MPDPIPFGDDVVPPSGWILVQDQDGNRFWIDPESVQESQPRTELTEDQLARVQRLDDKVGDLWKIDAEGFMRDSHPEKEILLWERIVDVFETECERRGFEERSHRQLCLRVCVGATIFPDANALLNSMPEAKRLGDLESIFEGFT